MKISVKRADAILLRRIACLGVLLACTSAGILQAQERTVAPLPSLAPLIDRISPAVVNISVSGTVANNTPLIDDPLFRRFFEFQAPQRERSFQSAGSGVIVDAGQGYLLTNHHVVENAEKITVTLADNQSMPATVVGSDAGSDLAVLKVDNGELTQIQFAASDDLKVGDYVVAIGNPFGFANTVTAGIVSGLGRRGLNRDAYEDFIQTDASINPGNSGGALVNLNGELVGINSAIISRGGGNIGIGFAIPVDMVRSVMEQLLEFGEVRRGLLGVGIVTVTSEAAEDNGLPNATGALVTEVNPESAAEAAGLAINDFIISINGEAVDDSVALRNTIGLMRPGERVEITYLRDGSTRTTTAILDTRTAEAVASAREPTLDPVFDGVELVPDKAANGADGLRVGNLNPESVAAERGLRVGDVITFVNRQRVRSVEEARQIVADARTVILQVQRDNRALLILLR